MKYDVVIIGSGLGGLQCGHILSKNGMNVCVLERSAVLGGCIQSFKRKGQLFDTGFHYVGGLDEGQPLNRLFSYMGLMNLPWKKMDPLFDEVRINDKSFFFAQGHDEFIKCLADEFPHQREELKRYTEFLKQVGIHIFDSFKPKEATDFYGSSLFSLSAKNFIGETISDPLLRQVLTGCSLKMELHENLPLYTFAQINNSFIQSAWRLDSGGSSVADTLAESIRNNGGEVRTKAEVTELIEEDGKITKVVVNGEEIIETDWVISNAHPTVTIALVKNSDVIRKVFRRRMDNMKNSFGMFTANIKLKPNTIPHLNRNQYIYKNADQWNYTPGKTDRVLVSYYNNANHDGYAEQLDLLTPMLWEEVEEWANKPIGKRGEDYVAMKNIKTQQCIDLASSVIGDLADSVETYYTSTPISYMTYTNTINGTAYGIRKDYTNTMMTILSARTPVKNLLLTGENLNLHGILGVSMTSCMTCAEIIGMEKISEELGVRS